MRIKSVVGAGIGAALALGLALPTYAVPQDVPRAHLPAQASDRAGQALAHVQAIFDRHSSTHARAATPGAGRDATLALRDLIRYRSQLRGTAAREADRLLARPTASRRTCTANICVHWSPASVNPADDDGDEVPNYIEDVRQTVNQVHQAYVGAGYRAPRPDGARGGNNKTDVYIRNVGALGLYGFCTSDKPFRQTGPFDSWAYCVLDNNYTEKPFRGLPPLENMQVTAAHEYFHAVQFAYDAFEDAWFMEATATWAEDELFTDINDNLQYLARGPQRRPLVPLDKFELGGTHQYGDWIFFRYLTEHFPTGAGMPSLVRQMWQRADGSAGARDMYSLQAIRSALAARGQTFGRWFARFADANRRPAVEYAEGADNGYPVAPLSGSRRLAPGESSGWIRREVDHLGSTTLRFKPAGLVSDTALLRVKLDLPDTSRGSRAMVTSYAGGVATPEPVSLNRIGVGSLTVPLLGGDVSRVEVTLVNASARTRCWVRATSPFSCFGVPRDDNLTQRVRVTAVP
jgi:hypothetical protein